MWIVRLALNRPYTFIVLSLMILALAPVIILRTQTDIFSQIDVPVISIAWQYTGLNPEEVEGRLTTPFEKTHYARRQYRAYRIYFDQRTIPREGISSAWCQHRYRSGPNHRGSAGRVEEAPSRHPPPADYLLQCNGRSRHSVDLVRQGHV